MTGTLPSGGAGERGFSLLEVLIAMLLLGIGVLGFAGLQMRALDTTGQSHFRAQAAVLAADFAERARMLMSANEHPACDSPPDATLADYRACLRDELLALWDGGDLPPAGQPAGWVPGEETCLYTGPFNGGIDRCATPDVLARADMLEARFLVAQLLPGGTIDVRPCNLAGAAGAAGNVVCIFVGWRGTDASDDAACPAGGGNAGCLAMQVLL